jgi:hypothetical protein
LILQWQNSPNPKCIPTRIPGSQTTHNSNYSLLNSENLYAVGGVAPKNNSIGQKGMEIGVIYYF